MSVLHFSAGKKLFLHGLSKGSTEAISDFQNVVWRKDNFVCGDQIETRNSHDIVAASNA